MFSFLKKLFGGKKETETTLRITVTQEDWSKFKKEVVPASNTLIALQQEVRQNENAIKKLKQEARLYLKKAVFILERDLEIKHEKDLAETLHKRNDIINEYLKLKALQEKHAKLIADISPFLLHCRTMISRWESLFGKNYPPNYYRTQTKLGAIANDPQTIALLQKMMAKREEGEKEREKQEEEELTQSIIGIAFDQSCSLDELKQKWDFWVNNGGGGVREG